MRVKREKKRAHAKKILTLQPFLLHPYVVSVALKNMTVSSFCLLYEMHIKKMLCVSFAPEKMAVFVGQCYFSSSQQVYCSKRKL